jgi:hypothetical protein
MITIRRLMIAVAVSAALLSVLQAGVEMQRLAGALIVGGCIVVLACRLTVDAITRKRAAGVAINKREMIWSGLGSSMNALWIIGTANVFFFLVWALVEQILNVGRSNWSGPGEMVVAAISTVLAVRLMRHIFRAGSEGTSHHPPADNSPDQTDPIRWLE